MNWPVFFSAAAGVIAGVAVCGLAFWWVFYGGANPEPDNL